MKQSTITTTSSTASATYAAPATAPAPATAVAAANRDFKIRDYRRLDARSPMSGGLDRVRSVVACCGAKTQIKLLHYQLRTTRNCSSRIHFEDVFPKSQR